MHHSETYILSDMDYYMLSMIICGHIHDAIEIDSPSLSKNRPRDEPCIGTVNANLACSGFYSNRFPWKPHGSMSSARAEFLYILLDKMKCIYMNRCDIWTYGVLYMIKSYIYP